MGDYELMRLGFLLDLGLYYLGVASQPYKRGYEGFLDPVFSTVPSVPFYHLMRLYARRFAAMARTRRRRGCFGTKNDHHRFMFGGYTFARASSRHVFGALLGWAALELREGWRSWFSHVTAPPVQIPESAPASPSTL